MKFIDAIKEMVQSKSINPQVFEQMQKERRYTERFSLMPDDPISVTILGKQARVIDISYGGLALHVAGKRLPTENAFKEAKEISLSSIWGNMTIPAINVRDVRSNDMGVFVAYEFRHEDAETLVFMKSIIEPIHTGRSIYKVSPEKVTEDYRSNQFSVFKGEGPTDVLAEFNEDQSGLVQLLLTFPFEAVTYQLHYAEGKMQTTEHLKPLPNTPGFASFAKGKKHRKVDAEVIKEALSLVLGFESDIREELSDFVATLQGWVSKSKNVA